LVLFECRTRPTSVGTVRVTRELVERLELVEAETVSRLVGAMRTFATDPVPESRPFLSGVLATTGPQRYVNRAVGVGLDALDPDAVTELVGWFGERGLPGAVQLSSWAPAVTVSSLGDAGFVPAFCRSVLAVDPVAVPVGADDPAIEVVVVRDDAQAAAASAVMTAELGDGRGVGEEFMRADRACEGTTQLLALLDGRPVGCGSLTLVGRSGWLGAAATVAAARRRGVQTALLHARLRLALEAGCDLVGVTASVGSQSARNLQRLGFGLVQDQWVVQQR
jgi:GNAT superfamily N-acetyltransferase